MKKKKRNEARTIVNYDRFCDYIDYAYVDKTKTFHNNHEYVDLGLPSGVKWATCNIGASCPEDLGDMFSWGDVTPLTGKATKNGYHCCSSILNRYKIIYDILVAEKMAEYGLTKFAFQTGIFSSYSEFEKVRNSIFERMKEMDFPSVLEPSADAASVHWGEGWRTPQKKDIEELISCCKCEFRKGPYVGGCMVIGPNGKSIYLPDFDHRPNTVIDCILKNYLLSDINLEFLPFDIANPSNGLLDFRLVQKFYIHEDETPIHFFNYPEKVIDNCIIRPVMD